MKSTFTATDFETAHGKRWSICQVGLVLVEEGIIREQLSILVQPPSNFYWNRFIDIYGITPQMTAKALTFDKIWHQIKPYIENQNVVAHNGFSFDFSCIRKTLEYYGLAESKFSGHCTYRLYGEKLSSLCLKNKYL